MKNKTIEVKVGSVSIGAHNPIVIQSMTNTPTSDVIATTNQIIELILAGSELVRFTVKDDDDAQAVPKIKEELINKGFGHIPLVGDFHYNGHILLEKFPKCAQTLDKLRINPGNVGAGENYDKNFKSFIEIAIKYDKVVRIGVNFGSLDKRILNELKLNNIKQNLNQSFDEIKINAMIKSVIDSAKLAQKYGLKKNKIILSAKISTVKHLVELHRKLVQQTDLPIHLGLTEAGIGDKGTIATACGLGILLYEGIGNTIRVSTTPKPTDKRENEVIIAKHILQALGIRSFMPTTTSCPGCGRTNSKTFLNFAHSVTKFIEENTFNWTQTYVGVENLRIAVMGCIVNGPGESQDATIGISFPGISEEPICPVYINGKHEISLQGKNTLSDFKKIISNYIETTYEKKQ